MATKLEMKKATMVHLRLRSRGSKSCSKELWAVDLPLVVLKTDLLLLSDALRGDGYPPESVTNRSLWMRGIRAREVVAHRAFFPYCGRCCVLFFGELWRFSFSQPFVKALLNT